MFASLLLCIKLSAQTTAPSISYTGSPYSATLGTAINATPTNSAGTAGVIPSAAAYANVTLFAGTPGSAGFVNSSPGPVLFKLPRGVAHDAAGNIYTLEGSSSTGNQAIRKITPAGVVTLVAGGTYSTSEVDGTGSAAIFHSPNCLIVDPTSSFLYVGDYTTIRKVMITPGANYGKVTTVVGTNNANPPIPNYLDGNGASVKLDLVSGFAMDAAGNLYFTDVYNYRIRKMDPSYNVTTLAGSGTNSHVDGTGTGASFTWLFNMVYDGQGNLLVPEYGSNTIRKIAIATGVVTTIAGSGSATDVDGTGTGASFNSPWGIDIDGAGNFYIMEADGNKVRKMTAAGVVTTMAGSGTTGTANGVGTAAQFNNAVSITVVGPGSAGTNEGYAFIADQSNNTIRELNLNGYSYTGTLPPGLTFNSATGAITGTIVASSAGSYSVTVTGHNYYGTSTTPVNFNVSAAPVACFNYTTPNSYPQSTTNAITPLTPTISSGNFYQYGQVSTLAGGGSATGTTSGLTNGTGNAALFTQPVATCVDASGNLYVAENHGATGTSDLRVVTPAGVVTTLVTGGTSFQALCYYNNTIYIVTNGYGIYAVTNVNTAPRDKPDKHNLKLWF